MILRWLLILLLFLPTLWTHANEKEQRSQEILNFLMTGQGDSIYVRLNDDLKGKLTPAMFNSTFNDLQKQIGEFRTQGEWKEDVMAGVTIHFCDLQFERGALRFMTAFDANGKANTIRFIPVPPTPPTIESVERNKEKIEEQEIKIVCGEYTLPGTLTLPKGRHNVPVVIWVHGSGPQDRDETIGPNKPLRDLAWGMAERGIASIRYEKRTKVYGAAFAPAGEENYDTETVDDALAAVELAKSIESLNPKQIYIGGHSLGAMLAPRIASRSGGLAGIVMLAGNARPLEDLLVEQAAYVSSLQGELPEGIDAVEKVRQLTANIKALGTDAFDESIGLPLNTPRAYWEFSNAYKQVEVAKRLTLPVLILQGERDYQVTMDDFELWRSGLSGKANVSFKSYPALNHLFHEGTGKAIPAEYFDKERNIPEYVLDDIAGWIKDKTSIKE